MASELLKGINDEKIRSTSHDINARITSFIDIILVFGKGSMELNRDPTYLLFTVLLNFIAQPLFLTLMFFLKLNAHFQYYFGYFPMV